MSRILVVEDDPAILAGLADNLRCEGYDVQQAANGEAAAPGARGPARPHHPGPDAAELSGYEVCTRLRAQGRRGSDSHADGAGRRG